MTRDQVLDYCTKMTGAVEDYPFGDEVAVFKVGGKMFALVMLAGEPGRLNLKCDPEWALELRAKHAAVIPGYHANKRHWNTVELDGTVPDAALHEMIDHSHELIVSRLPRAERARLGAADGSHGWHGDWYPVHSGGLPTGSQARTAVASSSAGSATADAV